MVAERIYIWTLTLFFVLVLFILIGGMAAFAGTPRK